MRTHVWREKQNSCLAVRSQNFQPGSVDEDKDDAGLTWSSRNTNGRYIYRFADYGAVVPIRMYGASSSEDEEGNVEVKGVLREFHYRVRSLVLKSDVVVQDEQVDEEVDAGSPSVRRPRRKAKVAPKLNFGVRHRAVTATNDPADGSDEVLVYDPMIGGVPKCYKAGVLEESRYMYDKVLQGEDIVCIELQLVGLGTQDPFYREIVENDCEPDGEEGGLEDDEEGGLESDEDTHMSGGADGGAGQGRAKAQQNVTIA